MGVRVPFWSSHSSVLTNVRVLNTVSVFGYNPGPNLLSSRPHPILPAMSFGIDRTASISFNSSPPFDSNALLRRFSTPSPYTGLNAPDQPAVQVTVEPPSQEHGGEPSSKHNYILKSRGRDYATIVVKSRAPNVLEPPLLHFGDELNGLVVLPRDNLNDLQSMEVVVSLFPNCGAPN